MGRLRVLITGSAGQLGVELQKSFADAGAVIAAAHTAVDISQDAELRAFIRDARPDVVLNAAAYTAVDRAESEPQKARTVNADAPRVMAEECRRANALLVHYSTDYVFDGLKQEPWIETDTPNPLSVYGATKLAGEQAVAGVGGRYLIFRTSWVYGPHGKNFLLTMLRLGQERERMTIVDDQVGAPTTSAELARVTHAIVSGISGGRFGENAAWAGTYHMTCSGSTSWFGFAEAIFTRAEQMLGMRSPELVPILTSDYPTAARRPLNSVLSNAKLRSRFGVAPEHWETALDEVFERLAAERRS